MFHRLFLHSQIVRSRHRPGDLSETFRFCRHSIAFSSEEDTGSHKKTRRNKAVTPVLIQIRTKLKTPVRYLHGQTTRSFFRPAEGARLPDRANHFHIIAERPV